MGFCRIFVRICLCIDYVFCVVNWFMYEIVIVCLAALEWSLENRTPSEGTRRLPRVGSFRVGAWQFYWYQSVDFKWFLVTLSPVDIGNLSVLKISHWIFLEYWTFISFCSMDPPPPSRRGWGRPRGGRVDDEAASAPHNPPPPPPPEPQGQPGFQVPPMPQPGFFPPMTPEAYQAYMNF